VLDQRLIVFVRAPRPGAVKTRLAAELGGEPAAFAYRRLVEKLLHQLGSLSGVELHFTPSHAEAEIESWMRPAWRARPQTGDDLGSRMHLAFLNAFAEGANRVVLIGSDCPDVGSDDIVAAWDKLSDADVVLGPAKDGGYWLIGLRQPQPELFTGIPWSTNAVLGQTIVRAGLAGLQTCLLRPLADVDTLEDWQRFLGSEATY
jgi:rSAM/selenodomain-associated transferase 1